MKKLKLSAYEQEVYSIIKCAGSKGTYISTIALVIAIDHTRTFNPNNSIVSAIRQINRKLEKAGSKRRIGGDNAGRLGKVVRIVRAA